MYNAQFDLRGKRIQDTYEQVSQYDTSSGTFFTGQGESFKITSSYSVTSSYCDTASFSINGGTQLVTASTYPITASWATNAINGGTQLITSSTYQITASYSETSSIAPFNGNRTIKRSGYTGINVGGDNVDTFLNNFFFPFIPATVVISGVGTYQIGTLQTPSITTTITQNDETIFGTGSVFKDSVIWNTEPTIPPYSFTFSDTNISSNHSYQSSIQVNNNGSPTIITSNTIQASFIYPYLWGMSVTPGLSGTNLYTEFTRQIVTQGNETISLIGNTVYIYFCYPSSYPALSSILDPNLFEIINSFEYSSSVSVTSSGLANDWTTTYKVYRTSLVADPNGNFQFEI
jgi:hypothetical protein